MSGPITRSNRPRVPVETPPRGRSRHGCWTCRIRRKKCDEQQAGEGLCGNCSRLQIDCIGWGERRPEWIKDPAQLKAFKDSVKAQIHRHSRASSDPIPNIVTDSPAPTDAPASAHPSSSKTESHEEILGLLPHLALPDSLIRPASSGSMDPYNYRVFVEHIRILVNAAKLPRVCDHAFADAASLGEWKHDELAAGRLSFRELARRAIPIERALIDTCDTQRLSSVASLANDVRHSKQEDREDMLQFIIFADDDDSHTSHASSDMLPELGLHASVAATATLIQPSNGKPEIFNISASLAEESRAGGSAPEPVSLLPHLAGLLFLHSIVSGLNQKVPEIISTSDRIIRLLLREECLERVPKMQRLLAAALVGCLSDSEVVIGLFSSVIATIDHNETACNSAITLAQRGKEVDYTD